ncbi:hypothetical protein Hanom_Chr07g00676841 [Helianthus anomalus]
MVKHYTGSKWFRPLTGSALNHSKVAKQPLTRVITLFYFFCSFLFNFLVKPQRDS